MRGSCCANGLVGQVGANHSGAERSVRNGVNQNKTAGDPVLRVRIEKQREGGFELHIRNIIHLQAAHRFLRQRVDVHAVAKLQRLGARTVREVSSLSK